MGAALKVRRSQWKVLLMKDRFIGNKSDRRLDSRAGSSLEPQLCFLAITHRFIQGDLNLSLPIRCFLKSPANQPVFCTGAVREVT